jgi:hypothetical protein
MADHRSSVKGINWADGYIEYRDLHAVLAKAVAGFGHLYAYGVSKRTFLAGLTRQLIHNLELLNFHPPDSFNQGRWCTLPCHKSPKFACTTKRAHSLYDWLMKKNISSKVLPT